MKHHPKSNNGVFSKKQKRASRSMMYARGGGFDRSSSGKGFIPHESSLMGALAAGILALVGRQRRP